METSRRGHHGNGERRSHVASGARGGRRVELPSLRAPPQPRPLLQCPRVTRVLSTAATAVATASHQIQCASSSAPGHAIPLRPRPCLPSVASASSILGVRAAAAVCVDSPVCGIPSQLAVMALRRPSRHFLRLATALDSGAFSLVRFDDCRARVCVAGVPDEGVPNAVVPSSGVPAASSLVRDRRCPAVVPSAVVVEWRQLTALSARRRMATVVPEAVEEDGEALLVRYLERLKNYEKEGVPRGAGTDSADGFDLERMERLLVRLGSPLSAYSVVHVAGTKGKGSTVSFIGSILRAAGLSVGTYTSPHVTSIRERITAGNTGEPVSAISLRKLMSDVQAVIDEAVAAESGLLTHFEVLTALAFTYFARENVDVAVVETGLGGARDATNVISAEGLGVAVIVGIGCEHLTALGGTLESIALAKAGIIKENRPVIVGPQKDSRVYDIIEKVAAAKLAPLIAVSRSMIKSKTGMLFTCTGHPYQFCDMTIQCPPGSEIEALQKQWKLGNVKLRALGAHQQDNALTAVSAVLALRSQGWKIPDFAIRTGLETTEIAGRFQVVGSDSSKALGCLSARLILDGAHTEESAMALAKTLRDGFPSARLAFVVAMASDKDHHSFARALLAEAKPEVVVTTRVPVAGSYGRSFTADELAECWTHAARDSNQAYRCETSGLPLDSEGQLSIRPSVKSAERQQREANTSSIEREDSQANGESLVVLSLESIQGALCTAAAALERRYRESNQELIVCVAGSLHAVAATLTLIQDKKINSDIIQQYS